MLAAGEGDGSLEWVRGGPQPHSGDLRKEGCPAQPSLPYGRTYFLHVLPEDPSPTLCLLGVLLPGVSGPGSRSSRELLLL